MSVYSSKREYEVEMEIRGGAWPGDLVGVSSKMLQVQSWLGHLPGL